MRRMYELGIFLYGMHCRYWVLICIECVNDCVLTSGNCLWSVFIYIQQHYFIERCYVQWALFLGIFALLSGGFFFPLLYGAFSIVKGVFGICTLAFLPLLGRICILLLGSTFYLTVQNLMPSECISISLPFQLVTGGLHFN